MVAESKKGNGDIALLLHLPKAPEKVLPFSPIKDFYPG